MRARIAAGQPARPAGGQAPMSGLVPTFSERETGQSGGCRQRLGRAVEQAAGSWRRRGRFFRHPGSRVTGPAAVMAGHAGSARMRARIAKSRQGGPTVCSCPLCTRKSAILASLNGLDTSRHPRQHRAFRGIHQLASDSGRVESDAGGWQTVGASAVSQSDPWYFSAVREPVSPRVRYGPCVQHLWRARGQPIRSYKAVPGIGLTLGDPARPRHWWLRMSPRYAAAVGCSH